jgi:hypothetical protein
MIRKVRAWPDWVWTTVLAVLAASMRIPGMSQKPYWIAEIQEFAHAYRGSPGQDFMYSAGVFLGFYYHQVCHQIGLPPVPWVVRLPAFLAGTLLAPAVYTLFAASNRRSEGFITAVFLALSLPLVAASQEARLYAGLTLFLSAGLAIDLLWGHGRLKVGALAVADALALACHPYALFWIVIRWVCHIDCWRKVAGNARLVVAYFAVVSVPAVGQAVEILVAREQFRELHAYFTLQPYPPGIEFFTDLLGHLGTGAGAQAAIFGLLVLGGAFAMMEKRGRNAAVLLAWSFGAPLLAALVIWLGRGRYSFVHFLPASVGLFALAANGVLGLSRVKTARLLKTVLPLAVLALIVVRMTMLDLRYHARPTRLEMGSDVKSACQYLGAAVKPGDAVVTRYDKYFTAVCWYCGKSLPCGTPVFVPDAPESDFILQFLHLRAQPGEALIQRNQIHDLSDLNKILGPSNSVYLLVPQFEDIEGAYSESLGWYNLRTALGPSTQIRGQVPSGWSEIEFPVLKIYVNTGGGGATGQTPADHIRQILSVQERPWM